MPQYFYTAQNARGKKVKGSTLGQTAADVEAKLQRENLTVLKIQEARTGFFGNGGVAAAKASVKTEELVVFSRQMATMISAGLPLLETLEILAEQTDNRGFQSVLGEIIEDVRGGSDLSAALSRHPRIFKNIYVSMVKAGEASGQLDEILTRLAEFQEASARLAREIKSAMTYPVVSLCLVFGITTFLMIGIIPKFEDIFEGLNIDLPWITRFLLDVSYVMRSRWYLFVGGMVLIFMAWKTYTQTTRGRYQWDWFKLHMPIFGDLFTKVVISRFSRTFATLIKSGVPILGALEIVAQTAGNEVVRGAIDDARESVRQGETLAEPLSYHDVFPPMVTRMISVGEKSGSLETLLEKISEFYDEQVATAVEALTSLIEPLMIGIMGFLVGGIVLAVFLPIFKIQQSLAGS
jgi:type IV pilus assembly protein PilC